MNRPLKNLLTDVAGLRVGNSGDERVKTGVTVVIADVPATASVHVMGGSPGTRETDLLAPEQTVGQVDAIVLSGGSAFGLDAAGVVMTNLAAAGRGHLAGTARVPIVPAAILFDLLNGGDKDWGREPPYRRLADAAYANAGVDFGIGSVGAGAGANTVNLKGGLGSASARIAGGVTVAALVAVNAVGQATMGDTRHFWAAPFEVGDEFGGLGYPAPFPPGMTTLRHKLARPHENTTLAVVATDARLTKAEAKRLAVMAHDGFARALWPSHTPFDGDLVFALATGGVPLPDPALAMIELGAAAAACVARAIARGIYAATPAPDDRLPTWVQRFG